MPSILFIVPRFHTNLIPIIDILQKNKINVQMLVSYIGGTESHRQLAPIVIDTYNKKNFQKESKYSNTWPKPLILFNILKKLNPDIIIVRGINKHSITSLLLVNLFKGKKIIYYDQSAVYSCLKLRERIKKKLKRNILNLLNIKVRISPVLTESYVLNSDQSEFIKETKAYFLPFTAGKLIKNNSVKTDDYFKILCVGKFREYKNLLLVLKSISKIQDRSNFHVTFVGQCKTDEEYKYLEKMKKYENDAHLINCVSYKLNVPYKDMHNVYKSHDILLLPSKREVASVSIVEAMRYSLLVIATNLNGTSSYIKDNFSGLIFESDNETQLAEKIESVISNLSYFNRMIDESKKLYNKKYSEDKYYLNLYNILSNEYSYKLE